MNIYLGLTTWKELQLEMLNIINAGILFVTCSVTNVTAGYLVTAQNAYILVLSTARSEGYRDLIFNDLML